MLAGSQFIALKVNLVKLNPGNNSLRRRMYGTRLKVKAYLDIT
jgi:hypothetical protein